MPSARSSLDKGGAMREAAAGASLAVRGLRTWMTSPRLMLLGLIPGAITAIVLGAGAVVLALRLTAMAGAVADALVEGDGWWHGAVEVIAALAILGAAALVAIYTFTALTLAIGAPFFEHLSREVDAAAGHVWPSVDEPWWRAIVRGLGEAARLALLTVPLAAALFLIGLIPVVGGVSAFVLGACFGGWFLAIELSTPALTARGGVTLAQRRAVLGRHRARVVGFGAVVFMGFLLPLGAVLLMPAAVAGATHLAQSVAPAGESGEGAVTESPQHPPHA